MFSRQEQLDKRTPKDGVDRKQFINLLVDEFLQTNSSDCKHQVLANLANFAYDPINYEYLRESGALDIFLHQISGQQSSQEDSELVVYACSGLCNLCLDPINADYILKYDGIKHLINLLTSEHEETRLNIITTLIFLADRIPKDEATKPQLIKLFLDFKGKTNNARLKNLATVFLEDVCGDDAVKKYQESVAAIPLPL